MVGFFNFTQIVLRATYPQKNDFNTTHYLFKKCKVASDKNV
jgi:hypothetical protein